MSHVKFTVDTDVLRQPRPLDIKFILCSVVDVVNYISQTANTDNEHI